MLQTTPERASELRYLAEQSALFLAMTGRTVDQSIAMTCLGVRLTDDEREWMRASLYESVVTAFQHEKQRNVRFIAKLEEVVSTSEPANDAVWELVQRYHDTDDDLSD